MELRASEKEIQKAIISYLEYRPDAYFVRNNSFAGSFQRANGSRGWIKNNKPGAPDLILCFKGKWIGLEIKCLGGKQSELQKQAEQEIIKAGGVYKIIRDLEEIKILLETL